MDEKTLDKILKPYFDVLFKNSQIKIGRSAAGEVWQNIVDENDRVLLGKPYDDDTWYTNGRIIGGLYKYFDVTPKEIYKAIARYANKKFGLDISSIL
jgi:hypothetical protein